MKCELPWKSGAVFFIFLKFTFSIFNPFRLAKQIFLLKLIFQPGRLNLILNPVLLAKQIFLRSKYCQPGRLNLNPV